MSDAAIEVEGVSKRYRLGQFNARSLREEVEELFRRRRGNGGADGAPADAAEFWALKDVSFKVERGEVLGIIGRNGAGKSTLLKILSRITEPTAGEIRVRGRVASLLEVGTGFHPELTGRENIYLNGAILGMRRAEIAKKFDEIVAFAEVEKFLDTPVKRYSSGMYVRLAFAVAAHLEPEILVVDEVLAVGDGEFQRKCLGRMSSVSNEEGRTVLFVSHNMQAVRQLCRRAIWLEHGRIGAIGGGEDIVNAYLTTDKRSNSLHEFNLAIAAEPPDPAFRLKEVDILQDGVSGTEVLSGRPVEIRFDYEVLQNSRGLHVYFMLYDSDGSLIFESSHNGDAPEQQPLVKSGSYVSTAIIPADLLAERRYELRIQAGIDRVRGFFNTPPAVKIDVHSSGIVNRAYAGHKTAGKLAPHIPWRTEEL